MGVFGIYVMSQQPLAMELANMGVTYIILAPNVPQNVLIAPLLVIRVLGLVSMAVNQGTMVINVTANAPPAAEDVIGTFLVAKHAQPVKTAIMEVHVSSVAQLIVALIAATRMMAIVWTDVMTGSLVTNAMLSNVSWDIIRMVHSV